jgi:iron complex transport system substrate-binding protein
MKKYSVLFVLLIALGLAACSGSESSEQNRNTQAQQAEPETRTVTDMMGRTVTVPVNPTRVICSGPGCLRYLTYLQAQDRVIAVDSIEKRKTRIDARPYAMANPQFAKLPLFGEFRGHDNPELIAALDPQPQVIFKTYRGMGTDPQELQDKTGIPVVSLDYGDLNARRAAMNTALNLMGEVLGKQERAQEVIAFMDAAEEDLGKRAAQSAAHPTCYVGGIASKGPHGFRSTEPGYPPFAFLNAHNVAAPTDGSKPSRHADIAKEQIVQWEPDYIFVDLSTIRAGSEANSLFELNTDPSYKGLKACLEKRIFGVLPYNWYTSNHGNTLADAYFIGKTLYPDAFADVDPAAKADEIYSFLVGKPVFGEINKAFGSLAFKPLDPSVLRIGDNGEILAK